MKTKRRSILPLAAGLALLLGTGALVAQPPVDDIDLPGQPAVVLAALPLLNLVRQIGATMREPDLDALRQTVIEAVKTFERKILALGVPPERARAAHYALCATVDDVLLSTAWGASTMWSRQGMVSTFHMDVTGGERFFDLLEHLHRDPGNLCHAAC